MTSEDDDWSMESDDEILARYQNTGVDLSHPINTGQRISEFRVLSDLTVKELAEKCGITTQVLLALEAGLMQLETELATTISTNLGVSVADIYEDDSK